MKKTVYLTQNHITLIKNLRFRQFTDSQYGIDNYEPWGGSYPIEDMAFMLGYANRVIRSSQNEYLGPVYEAEIQNYLESLADDFAEHLNDYEDILHQFCDKGGLIPGKYSKKSGEVFWNYEGETVKEREETVPLVVEKDWDMISEMG